MKQVQPLKNGEERLFLSFVEQLSRSFVQLRSVAELAGTQDAATAQMHWQTVQELSQSTLRLAESYALHLRTQGSLSDIQLEQVTISSLLYDTAQELQPFAKRYDVELRLEPGPRMLPVVADRALLRSAFAALGQVFVLAQSQADEKGVVKLAGHRSRYGVVAGLYGNLPHLGADSLRRARRLSGMAREPLHNLASGPVAGVFVADALLQSLEAKLHAARYCGMTGLAVTLDPGRQMHLI